MKGIVFTELLELVEEPHGFHVTEKLLEASGSQGAYTAVGTYGHRGLVAMVVALAQITEAPIPDLTTEDEGIVHFKVA